MLIGIIMLLVDFFLWYFGTLDIFPKDITKRIEIILLIAGLLCIIISFADAFSSYTGLSSDYTRICQSCGRGFSDAANNESIARTRMCTDCYGNYQRANEALR